MPKAGTGWLFDQLQHHADFWIPAVKEIHYLDRSVPKLQNVKKQLTRYNKTMKRQKKRRAVRRAFDVRDEHFLTEAVALAGEPMDIGRYAELFRFKGDAISGDITPAYSALDEETIAKIARQLPDVRIVFLVRDPVARAWSHICMAHRAERFDAALLDDEPAFRAFLQNWKHISGMSYPSRIAGRWKTHAPNIKFHHFFFDDIPAQPQAIRRSVLEFLGADPDKPSGEVPVDLNRKAKAAKLPLPDSIKSVLVEHFAEELRLCAQQLGGHAIKWAQSYGVN
jgi:hypothetical protein